MEFSVGDSVLVLDEDFSGTIKKINGNTISIETKDGFLLDYQSEELVKRKSDTSVKEAMFSNSNIHDIISEKEQSKRKQRRTKVKERYQPTMEVDLHINQLVKSPKEMSNYEMLNLQLETAKRQLEFAISKRIQKIVFIHGVGEGVLKAELEFLFSRYNNVKYYDANYQKYGLGATEVYVYQNVEPN